MRGHILRALAFGLLAIAVTACSGEDIADLPVRDTPQTNTPHNISAPGAPLRGTAVAVDMTQP